MLAGVSFFKPFLLELWGYVMRYYISRTFSSFLLNATLNKGQYGVFKN
jgi:hypothetical protein